LLQRIRLRTGRTVAVLFDRFEDYLRCHRGTDISDAFDAEFSHAIAGREGRFVVAMHRDALPDFERLAQYIPNLLGYLTELKPLDRAEARNFIRQEAERRGIVIQPEIVDVLAKARASAFENGVRPFPLVMGITRLFDAAAGKASRTVSADMIGAYGGADRLILESLDMKIAGLNQTHRELFFRWGNILIDPNGRSVALSERSLTDYSGKLNRFAVSLMPRLVELEILRTIDLGNETRYEIARQSLVPIVRDWWQRQEAASISKRKARFRVRSISVAVGSIMAVYAAWLPITMRR